MSAKEIAKRGGLAKSTVIKVSKLKTWDSLPIATIMKYSFGCGVDLERPGRVRQILRGKCKIAYWKNGTAHQRQMIQRIIQSFTSEPATAAGSP